MAYLLATELPEALQLQRLRADPFLAAISWLRGWPQVGKVDAPAGYTKVDLPPSIENGDWCELEAAGLLKLADDWRWRRLRPVALPSGWRLAGQVVHRGYAELFDGQNRRWAELRAIRRNNRISRILMSLTTH
jgi:hypothetical protein